MSSWWQRWVDHVGRPIDTRILASVRIGMAGIMALDMLWTWWLGLVPWLYVPGPDSLARPHRLWLLTDLGPEAVHMAFWGAVVSYLFVAAGLFTRPAIVVGILCEAQIGMANTLAEQGVDHICRTMLLILLFSGSDGRWSLGPAQRRDTVPGWPVDLMAWLLVLIYTASGVCKPLRDWSAWLDPSALPATYRIMADPLSGVVDPVLGHQLLPLMHAMDWATLVFEIGAVMLLTRYARWWAVMGVVMHLGLAATMKLGQFPYVILAMYPIWFAEPALRWWDARRARATGS